MAALIGVQIKDLSTAGAITGTTELPIQRVAVTKAEKISITNLTNYTISSPEFITSLNTSVNNAMDSHVNGVDPHGDRVYANTILTTHSSAADPHGDRTYALNTINSSITTHSSAVDPHGDRSYTNVQITAHNSAADPHGDRAFTTTSISTASTAANTYTDTKVNSEFTARIGTTITPLTAGKVPDTYINKELSFSSYSSFPATGLANVLYVDTTGNDVYRWDSTAYVNLTPAVDVGNLNLTTNDVAPGSNTDRQYLTVAKDTEFTNKVSDVLGETIVGDEESIFSRKTANVAYVKNLNTEGNIDLLSNTTTISIVDNNYTYSATDIGNVTLVADSAIRSDYLSAYDNSEIIRVKGEVFVYCTTESVGSTIINENNVFSVDARTALTGITQPVPPVTTATISNDGISLSGTALANSTLEIYDETYTLVTTRPINALGNFTHTFSPALDVGRPIYLYVRTPSNERSTRYTLYTPNLIELADITGVSIAGDGLTVRGRSERLVTVEVFDATPTSLGTATADSNGFFAVTLSTALVEAAEFTITSVNSLSTTGNTYAGTVNLEPTVAAYEVVINNGRTSVSGKGHADGSVSIYDSTDVLLITLPINSGGSFSGVLPAAASSLNSFKLIVEENSNLSQTVVIDLPAPLIMQNPPNVVPILVDSIYDFVYKDITKRINNTNFEFNIEIDIPNTNILLKGTNNLGKSAKWAANLQVTVESI